MKNNEKMNINIILYITAIGIIFSTIFFIYNAAQTKYIESVGAEQDETEEVQTNEEVEIINNYIQNDSNDTISSLLKTIVSPLCSTFKTLIFST